MPDNKSFQLIFAELQNAVLDRLIPVSMEDLDQGIVQLRGRMTGIIAALERLKGDKLDTDAWDRWYSTIPRDIKDKIDLHDFKRLGESFKQAFRVQE